LSTTEPSAQNSLTKAPRFGQVRRRIGARILLPYGPRKPMTTVLLTIALFALVLVGLSVGIILSDRSLKGSCGGMSTLKQGSLDLDCGTCERKAADICPTDNRLVAIALVNHPARPVRGHKLGG
jgi:hypothetical protein